MVTIGHASIDENGKARAGAAGDQTGKEVCTRSWYNKNWLCCLRAKDRTVADKIAKAMEQAVANPNIGYDQDQRTTCYYRAAEVGFDLSKITKPCETDCSALVAVCVNAAGIKVSQHIWTGNEEAALLATGAFDSFRASKYLITDENLARGDILVSGGHTVVVLTNGSKYVSVPAELVESTTESEPIAAPNVTLKPDYAQEYFAKTAGTYKVTASLLNVRTGAGTDKAIITSIPKDMRVMNYGFFSFAPNGKKWLYVTGIIDGKAFEGFCSETYLVRV
jgi:hypothetical protein